MKKLSILIFLSILLLGSVYAQISYCCEKTVEGALCQNAPVEQCSNEINPVTSQSYRQAPTSCESTSYCKLGCCYDSKEGTCMENTPQQVCSENNGIWDPSSTCDIPQCSLGCCIVGDQAAFVSQTRCKRLSSLYGLTTDFRTNFNSEIQCIASVTSDVEGACVFTQEYEKTCRRTTKRECQELGLPEEGILSGIFGEESQTDVEFYEGRLCSDETLGTSCGPTEETTCVEGEDKVYFVDSCGNLANVYDSSKAKENNYWTKITEPECGIGESNADSANCGNCDYYLGSTCQSYDRNQDKRNPVYGDNICRDLSCEYGGTTYQHGETWCAKQEGSERSLPGSRHFRLVCYNGEVTVEPCADYRQEICIEDNVNGFSSAGCVVNKWEDCVSVDNERDCANSDRRDCTWIGGVSLKGESEDEEEKIQIGGCFPSYPPGFDFWNTEGDSESLCSQADATCTVTFEAGLGGKEKCVENCECLDGSWESNQQKACQAIGDCGSKTNYLGEKGYNEGGVIRTKDEEDDE